MNGLGWIGRDVRDAVRSLLRDRGSVALALLALSLGIGATAVIFSVVYSVLVNTFPFENPSRVVHFYIQAPNQPGRSAWYPAPEFVDYRAQNRVFSAVLGGASFEALYNLENATYRVRGALIDPHAPSALGVRPVLGRTNLTVLERCEVADLVIAEGRVSGLRVRHEGREKTLSARREVVLSAGAVNSPAILMASGIGPAAELGRIGIVPVLDLPGVGKNLRDHVDGMITVRSTSRTLPWPRPSAAGRPSRSSGCACSRRNGGPRSAPKRSSG